MLGWFDDIRQYVIFIAVINLMGGSDDGERERERDYFYSADRENITINSLNLIALRG